MAVSAGGRREVTVAGKVRLAKNPGIDSGLSKMWATWMMAFKSVGLSGD